MRALIQRVKEARVHIDNTCVAHIDTGLLVFLGVGDGDDEAAAHKLCDKITHLRIFADDAGKTNRALSDVGAQVLVVSQFTLYADCKRGNRPSFTQAAEPTRANELYEYFCELVRKATGQVQTGSFGADMSVELINAGPFTIWLDTATL